MAKMAKNANDIQSPKSELVAYPYWCCCSVMFLPTPLAVAWVFRLTFSPSSSPSPSSPSHLQLFVSLRYVQKMPWGEWVLGCVCYLVLHPLPTSITQFLFKLEIFVRPFFKTRSLDGSVHTFRSSHRFLEVPQKGVWQMIFWHLLPNWIH